MHHSFSRIAAAGIAGATTLVCVGMAAVAASERTANGLHQALMVGLAVVLVLGLHLLPALARRNLAAWLLWVGCVAVTVYNHGHFFAAATAETGAARAAAVTTTGEAAALSAQLDAIKARPTAAVAADLARAKSAAARCTAKCTSIAARVEALGIELAEAQRAAVLRDKLAQAAADHDQAREVAALDPVDREIARATGLPASSVSMLMAVLQSLLAELLGAVLWMLALPAAAPALAPVAVPRTSNTGQVPPLRMPPAPVPAPAAPTAPATTTAPRRGEPGNDHPDGWRRAGWRTPDRPGVYERRYPALGDNSGPWFCMWTGSQWNEGSEVPSEAAEKTEASIYQDLHWRGPCIIPATFGGKK